MKITLQVPIKNPDGFKEVFGEFLCNLAPHLASVATFAVHRGVRGLDWNVTNVETGMWVGKGFSRSEAIRDAKERLDKQTPGTVEAAYKNAPRRYPILRGEFY